MRLTLQQDRMVAVAWGLGVMMVGVTMLLLLQLLGMRVTVVPLLMGDPGPLTQPLPWQSLLPLHQLSRGS
jgi:hypothetical protein